MNHPHDVFDEIHGDCNYDADDDCIMRVNTKGNNIIKLDDSDSDDDMNDIDDINIQASKTSNFVIFDSSNDKTFVNNVDIKMKLNKNVEINTHTYVKNISIVPTRFSLPEICQLCGCFKHKHTGKKHIFLPIEKNMRCRYCACFYFEHKHSFNLNNLQNYVDFINNHPYYPFKQP
jgi:hypothetical protein